MFIYIVSYNISIHILGVFDLPSPQRHVALAKQQVAAPLHARCHSDTPGPCPAEDREAFEVQIVDRKPGGPEADFTKGKLWEFINLT